MHTLKGLECSARVEVTWQSLIMYFLYVPLKKLPACIYDRQLVVYVTFWILE